MYINIPHHEEPHFYCWVLRNHQLPTSSKDCQAAERPLFQPPRTISKPYLDEFHTAWRVKWGVEATKTSAKA